MRVAEIFTKGKVCKRPIVKLALLPITDNAHNENDELMSNWYKQKIINKTNDDLLVPTKSTLKSKQMRETEAQKVKQKEADTVALCATYAVRNKTKSEKSVFRYVLFVLAIVLGSLWCTTNGLEQESKYKLTQFENATAYFQNYGSGSIIDGKFCKNTSIYERLQPLMS